MEKRQSTQGSSDELYKRLERDASDIASFLAVETGLPEICVSVLTPYYWSDRRSPLCGIDVLSDGRRGLSTFSRNILQEMGWKFAFGLDAAEYYNFSNIGLSAHRRLAGCRRVHLIVQSRTVPLPK